MEEIIKFLHENRAGTFATVENGKPRLRPWGFLMAEAGKIYFSTGKGKNVHRQMLANPHVAFMTANQDFEKWLRISGEAVFVDDPAIRAKVFQCGARMKARYQTPDNPEFLVFYLKDCRASLHGRANETLVEVSF